MTPLTTTRAAHECREEFEKWYCSEWSHGETSHVHHAHKQGCWLAWQASRTTLLADKALVEEVHTDPNFKEACKQYKYGHWNQVDIAQAALDVIRTRSLMGDISHRYYSNHSHYIGKIMTLLTKELETIVEALERLAKLGNGEYYGNSVGNSIAIEALRQAPALLARVKEMEAERDALMGKMIELKPEMKRDKLAEWQACYAALFNQLNPVMNENTALKAELATLKAQQGAVIERLTELSDTADSWGVDTPVVWLQEAIEAVRQHLPIAPAQGGDE